MQALQTLELHPSVLQKKIKSQYNVRCFYVVYICQIVQCNKYTLILHALFIVEFYLAHKSDIYLIGISVIRDVLVVIKIFSNCSKTVNTF